MKMKIHSAIMICNIWRNISVCSFKLLNCTGIDWAILLDTFWTEDL